MKNISCLISGVVVVVLSCESPNTVLPVEIDPNIINISYQSWYRASPPVDPDSLWYYPPAWEFYWFSPRDMDEAHRVRRDEIVELSEEEKRTSQLGTPYEYVLRLHAIPSPPVDSLAPRFRKAWAGIMTPIPSESADKSEAGYFEFFIKADGGFNGKGWLRIQMGELREDVSLNGGPPNGRKDDEDTSTAVVHNYNPKSDLGWDLLLDKKEVYLIPGLTPGTWDTLRYGDPLLGPDSLDPAKDNWRQYFYDNGDINNYRYVCRRQGDGKTVGSSEDINSDGTVQTTVVERYFQYSIDLGDSLSPLIDTTVDYANPGVWRKYRIPLRETVPEYESCFVAVNDPNWSTVSTLRLIWSDFDSLQLDREYSLVFHGLKFSPD